MNEATARALIKEHYESAGVDEDKVHEIYTDDAVLEFPQGRERIRGKANIYAFRTAYPAKVRIQPRRTIGHDDLWISEGRISYNDAPPMNNVSIMEFRGDKVFRETIYFCDPWEPPEWRAQWVEPMDE
jgi:SnoaL-like protein